MTLEKSDSFDRRTNRLQNFVLRRGVRVPALNVSVSGLQFHTESLKLYMFLKSKSSKVALMYEIHLRLFVARSINV